jgi:hypothetical protein
MEKKITKIDRFNQLKAIPEVAENAELVEFIDHEIDLLQKKSASKKPAKKSDEYLALKQTVANALSDEPRTISEIINSTEGLKGLNTQKITPIMKDLVAEGSAMRTEDKGKALFAYVPFEDTEDEAVAE